MCWAIGKVLLLQKRLPGGSASATGGFLVWIW